MFQSKVGGKNKTCMSSTFLSQFIEVISQKAANVTKLF
jgi:hypothetical protein